MTDKKIAELIKRRRYQILVHSYLYYERDINLVSDDVFDKWSVELVELHKNYPDIAKTVDWDLEFTGWNGGSGAFLPYRNPKIVSIACHLIKDYSQIVVKQSEVNQVKNSSRSSKKSKKSRLF